MTETLSDKDALVRVVDPQALVRRTLVEWAGAPDATLEGDDYVLDGVITQILARVAELRQEAGIYETGVSEAGATIVGKQQS
ncbi:MAG: hypothetical protein Q7S87_18190 [Agitococcus sp.]|nr:hypothetical protein [Agitococcus sp.]